MPLWKAIYSLRYGMHYIQRENESCKILKILIMSKGREFWKVPKPVFKLTRFRKKVDHSIWLFTVHEFCDSVNSHVVHSAWDLKSNLNLILLTIFSLGFSQFRPCWGSIWFQILFKMKCPSVSCLPSTIFHIPSPLATANPWRRREFFSQWRHF